jgi:hypothetical protein
MIDGKTRIANQTLLVCGFVQTARLFNRAEDMDDKYKALLRQTADVVRTEIVTRANRSKAHTVIVDFIRTNCQMTYPEVATVFGLHPVTVNRIALRAGIKRGSGRRRVNG